MPSADPKSSVSCFFRSLKHQSRCIKRTRTPRLLRLVRVTCTRMTMSKLRFGQINRTVGKLTEASRCLDRPVVEQPWRDEVTGKNCDCPELMITQMFLFAEQYLHLHQHLTMRKEKKGVQWHPSLQCVTRTSAAWLPRLSLTELHQCYMIKPAVPLKPPLQTDREE